jgi:tRNA modification GTPase
MHQHKTEDIICAISSPPGVGAIALIRLSGKESIELVNKIFTKDISLAKGYSVHFGNIIRNAQSLDEVVVTVFRNPHSFTGEDSVEIACHGSTYIQQEILALLMDNGARMAEAGEFSKRAFFNGKMDLTQTEAIADLIHSESEGAHRLAMQQMKGGISKELGLLRDELIKFASLVELELDFAEEDVEFADRSELITLVKSVLIKVNNLRDSFQFGSAIKEGVNVAIVGKPNAGKSSWINALSNDDVAIVSNIAGTTRDKIEVPLILEGTKFRFIDTAGLRETEDIIEGLGVERAKDVISKAEIIIYMFDIADISHDYLDEAIKYVKDLNESAELLLVGNKFDTATQSPGFYGHEYGHFSNLHFVSTNSNEDIDFIKKEIVRQFNKNKVSAGDIVVTNARHYEALRNASIDLEKTLHGLQSQLSGDFVAMDIRQVIHHLGSITGEITQDNLLGHIFKNFCIGK